MFKLRVNQVTFESRCNDSIKKSKPKGNQLGILKIYAFCCKIQQSASGPGESAAEVTYLSIRMHLKSLLSGLRKA